MNFHYNIAIDKLKGLSPLTVTENDAFPVTAHMLVFVGCGPIETGTQGVVTIALPDIKLYI